MDYKSTINLPQTDFAMQANLAKREPEFLARWEREGLYAQVDSQTRTATTPYRFVDGPPYANGDIHIGHAVNKVLKDMIVKARRLDGHHAPFVPGWDCHGLPIELQVEKKHGKVGDKLDAKTFRARCREYANEQIARQREDFKRLGVLADWERPYLTMNPVFEAEQLRCLARIVDNGHVVRGFKPVHWCLDCGSSLAEAEVEYEDKGSTAIYVRFQLEDSAKARVLKLFGVGGWNDTLAKPVHLVIWTTTPWTLPANRAICVNDEINYSLLEDGSQYVVIATERLSELVDVLPGFTPSGAPKSGRELVQAELSALHPFVEGRLVPVLPGSHVSLDAGTGLVHTAPAHGVEDYLVGRIFNLPTENPVAADGVFVSGTPVVGGMHVRKSEAPILEALRSADALVHEYKITHSYPHCWRHKTPLIFRATPQWFIAMDHCDGIFDELDSTTEPRSVRRKARRAIRDVKWIPSWGQERIDGMVAGRPDWCISRQRYWGVPVAVFVHRESQTLHPQTAELLAKIADAVEREGLEAWFGSKVGDWLGDEAGEYEKCNDTLDVWFDSGVVHQCSFKANDPGALDGHGDAPVADLYLEGSDQHRGWFQSSLLTSTAMHGRAPYRAVLTHGFTVDEQGRKMSKSLGNVVAPQQVTKTLGADVLRLWVAASDYSGEIAISDNLLKRMADAYRRIRNTARFLLGNLHGFEPARDLVQPSEMVAIDRWALAQAAALQQEILTAYQDCSFHLVYQKLHNYCVVDLGGCYLDILKDRLYTTGARSLPRRSAQTAMWQIAQALVRWIAPILSFTADEIWQVLPGTDQSRSVFAQQWHQFPPIDESSLPDFHQRLRLIRDAVKKVLEDRRVEGSIGSSLNAELEIYCDGAPLTQLQSLGADIRFWFIVSHAKVLAAGERPAEAIKMDLFTNETIWIIAKASVHQKCERCWHQRPEVGQVAAHPTLCQRCVDNIDGAGETRRLV